MASVITTLCLVSSFIYQIACTQECSEGTFGQDCSSSCSARHCVNQSSCDPVSGLCKNGCLAGWAGLTCMQNVTGGAHAPVAASTGPDIVIALAAALAVLMVLILVLLAVLVIRMKLNQGPSKLASTGFIRTVPERNPTSVYFTPTPTNRSTRRDHINPSNNDSSATTDYITQSFTDNSTRREKITTSDIDIATRENITAINTDSPTPTDNIYTGMTPGNATEHIYTGIASSNTASAAKPSNYETLQLTEDNPYTSLAGRNVIVNV